MKLLVLNGPNLNMLGTREPEIYGKQTLADLEAACRAKAAELGAEIDFRQTNSEADLITWVQEAKDSTDGLIINPAAYGHTSIALMDALTMYSGPIVELHLSNIKKRETFRHSTYVSYVADGIICGFGGIGYPLAITALIDLIKQERK